MSISEINTLANDIAEIIKDYRSDEGVQITPSRVSDWVSQFNQVDQVFILQELFHILKKRYVSQATARKFLKNSIIKLAEDLRYDTPQSFLANTKFLDLQEEAKSQKELLILLDEIIQENYGMSLSSCASQSSRNFIYLDDVLCTGNTVFYDLKGWLETAQNGETILDRVVKSEVNLICLYIFVHLLNKKKLYWRFRYQLRPFSYKLYAARRIDNDYENPNSRLDFLLPLREGQSQEVLAYFERLQTGATGVFRSRGTPPNEGFFSSSENRIRFENILLEKGIEILGSVSVQKENIRPLGYTLPSQKNLGFGTLCFTWRNVPNNTPLVFWYASRSWMPLFEKRATIIMEDV